MSDDKTQEMPVMADAGDMPTETLHTVDAQSTYDQSQRSGRATQDDKPRVESVPAQGVPTYTASVVGANDGRKNRQTGDDIIRPSGRSGSTIALGDSQRGAFKPIQEWRRCGQRRSIRRSP